MLIAAEVIPGIGDEAGRQTLERLLIELSGQPCLALPAVPFAASDYDEDEDEDDDFIEDDDEGDDEYEEEYDEFEDDEEDEDEFEGDEDEDL